MQISKREFDRKKLKNRNSTHCEGKNYCDCRVRNFRKWLGVKKHGQPERLNPEDHNEDNFGMICDSLNTANK